MLARLVLSSSSDLPTSTSQSAEMTGMSHHSLLIKIFPHHSTQTNLVKFNNDLLVTKAKGPRFPWMQGIMPLPWSTVFLGFQNPCTPLLCLWSHWQLLGLYWWFSLHCLPSQYWDLQGSVLDLFSSLSILHEFLFKVHLYIITTVLTSLLWSQGLCIPLPM